MAITKAPKFKQGDIVRFKTVAATPIGTSLRIQQGHILKVTEEPTADTFAGVYILNTFDERGACTGGCIVLERSIELVPSDNLTDPLMGLYGEVADAIGLLDAVTAAEGSEDAMGQAELCLTRLREKILPMLHSPPAPADWETALYRPHFIENDEPVTRLAWVVRAKDEDVNHLLEQRENGDGRSAYCWVRLYDGTLMLSVFPAGETYLQMSDAGVCDWPAIDVPSDNLTGWAFDLYDDRGMLDHNDVVDTLDDLDRIANGRAIRLRGKVLRGEPVPAVPLARYDAAREMRLMLEAAREQFNFYADNHDAKGTPDSQLKAGTNRAMAARITAVLRGGKA